MNKHPRRPRVASILPIVALALGCSSSSTPGAANAGAGGATNAGGAGQGGAGGAAAAGRTLVLLFTSDEHSRLFSFSPEVDDFPAAAKPGTGALIGGIARRAAVLTKERAAAKDAGKASLTVSAGDNHMGALPHVAFESASLDYAAMVELRYDVTTLGNHELDFGPKALARSLAAAKAGKGAPPIVASNIHFSADSAADDDLAKYFSADPTDTALIHPYRVITADHGLKIGVVGVVGVDASHVAKSKAPVHFSELGVDPKDEADESVVLPKLYADLQPIVDTLRAKEKVDLVVALSHSGIADTSTAESIKQGEDYQIAANVSGIDVIVSGHQHIHDANPIVVKNAKSGRDVLVLNAGAYGEEVGRVELTVPDDTSKAPTWDAATQALLPVDDTTVPDPTVAADLATWVGVIEKGGPSGSYLEDLLSRVTETAVKDDPKTPGDLYFYPLSKTAFDVADVHARLSLSTDATLTQADALGIATDMALDSAGVVRAPLLEGATGVVSAADAFAVLPLGSSPTDGSIGYPLVRAFISGVELRGVFEAALAQRGANSDFDLGWAGVRVEYDATRPFIKTSVDLLGDKRGQVMTIALDTDHTDGLEQFDEVIYDRAKGVNQNLTLFSVVASSYVAAFAADVGVALKDDQGKPISFADSLLKRKDGTEVKQLESFFAYLLKNQKDGLPDRYNAKSPKFSQRLVCIKGC